VRWRSGEAAKQARTRGGRGRFIGARGGFPVASLEQRREVTTGSSTYGDAGRAGRGGPARWRHGVWRARTTSCLGVIPASGSAASGSAARLRKAHATSGGAGCECRGRAPRGRGRGARRRELIHCAPV
jgi:hypothetical protein